MAGMDAENREDMIRALLDERSRARDDQHRKEIDEQLAFRDYKANADEPEPEKVAEQRAAAAGGDKTTTPEGRTSARNKQSSG